jgi:tetratricopeptide (TPR) repeat protein
VSKPQDSITRKQYSLIATCLARLERRDEALQTCAEGLRHCPDDVELLYQEAALLAEHGDLAAAEARLRHLLNLETGAYFASVDPALRGYKAYHQLGVLCHRQRRNAEARAAWTSALAGRDDYLPSLLGLLEIALEEKDEVEFERHWQRLAAMPDGTLEADLLRARFLAVNGEFAKAREVLESAIERHPDAIRPRIVLSNVLLQENRDLDAAEVALRDILAMAPDHTPSQHNLRLLLKKKASS